MRVKTTCTRDCPDACGMLATVDDGRVVKLQGDPDHPVTRGFLCYRTSRFLERQYDPERLTSPLMRRGKQLEPVSWGVALGRIAETMERVRAESGGAAILNYRSGGSLGLMKHVTDLFFERFGPVTVKSGDICSGAGEAAQELDFGVADSHDLFDLLHSRTIVLWGKNPHVSNLHLLPVLREARSRGCRLILIDPVYHRGAELCDLVLQPRPGGDIALALGLIGKLFAEGHHDPRLASYCDNVEELREFATSRSFDDWARLADVEVEPLEALARFYADGPSAILVGWGMQRRTHGAATVRLLDALAAVAGHLGVRGGGASFYFKRRGAFDLSFTGGLATAPRAIPEALLGRGILEAADPPIRMVWVSNGNPVAMLPQSETVARALASRELTVVVDAFLTDTARCADVVLPTTTMLEEDDLVGSYGHHYLGNVRCVVPGPAGVRSDYEIVQALARRLELQAPFEEDVAEWKRRLVAPVSARGVTVETLEDGPRRNPLAPEVLFENRRFATPNARVNLVTQVDPTPPAATPDRPLLLMALATERAQASQWPSRRQRGPAPATLHPAAAGAFEEGQIVRLESEIASIEVRLCFDARQRRDVVLLPKGGWLQAGRCANALIPARETDEGGGAVYHDTPVRLVGIA